MEKTDKQGIGKRKKKAAGRLVGAFLVAAAVFLAAGCSTDKRLENENAYRQIGLNDLQTGDYAGAVEAFDNALAQRIGRIRNLEIDICYYKALAQFKNGDIEDCLATYTALVDYDEKNADAYFLRGNVFLSQEDLQSALADFAAAVKIKKNDYELYLEIADALEAAGDSENAQIYLNQALQIGGSDGESLRYQGMIALRQGNLEDAVADLEKALEAGDDESGLELGKVYAEQGEDEKASEMFYAYLEGHPEDTAVLNQLGCTETANGNYDTAIMYFEQGLAVDNSADRQELLRNEIAAYEQKGDFAAAREKMDAYLESYPEDEEAQREAVFLETR